MKNFSIFLFSVFILLTAFSAWAGPYSDAIGGDGIDAGIAGFVGPDGDGVRSANNYVNPIFVGWATGVVSYEPSDVIGPYEDNGIGYQFSYPSNCLGEVTGDVMHIASLGDMDEGEISDYLAGTGYGPGTLTLSFDNAITNGSGADFAAFENGFISDYTTGAGSSAGQIFAELGYIEVSTDGINFARFPSSYLNDAPTGGAGYLTQDATNIYNLVGKHVNAYGTSWGTPFDLDDLLDNELVLAGLVDLSEINFLRIIDIPGDGTFTDADGNSIYDAWVTWGSGGLDFEAVGVINAVPIPSAVWLMASGLFSIIAYRRKQAF